MAYHFTVEVHGAASCSGVRAHLAPLTRIEWFTIEASADSLTVGVSIPLRALSMPGLEAELVDLMTALVAERGCGVTDLFLGSAVKANDLSSLLTRVQRGGEGRITTSCS